MAARGTPDNPPNRFERLHLEREPGPAAGRAGARWDGGDASPEDPDAPEPDPRTELLRDPSRSVVATNRSPDIGFDASVNPYRGCEHGCVYCLAPDTPVLHADFRWRPLGEVRVGDVLAGFDEQPLPGHTRKLRRAVVEAVWWSRKPTWRLVTPRTEVLTTSEHRWLQARDFRWSRTEQLSPRSRLRRLPVAEPEAPHDDYRVGYVAGLSLGDGTFRFEPGWRSDKRGFPAAYWRVALIDREPLERLVEYLGDLGVRVAIRPFSGGKPGETPLWKVESRSLAALETLHALLGSERATRDYRRGFLAGFFDAEGHNGTSFRISQVDLRVLDRVQRHAASLGFTFRLERREGGGANALRLVGSLADRIRFFGVCDTAIARKRDRLFGRMPPTDPEPVLAVKPEGLADVVDIQTSTGTFYAAGLATHNCYARPTHEYLGMSAGLDFETRILTKPDAPALLRRKLASRGWQPQVVALSGVTDCYQPAERRLGITRGCLEVLAAFRNPVAVITKSGMVTRDADLLAELAAVEAASVCLSITTLDAELQRRMEPRASRPARRLAAIEHLARAGVPVGVMVAPVVPGLTDHEMPRILQAAADAGASFAGTIVLRLPHGVKGLFDDWLARELPERRARVLARIREVRGGALSDPRFGTRQTGEGLYARQLGALFGLARRRAGLAERGPALSTAAFRREAGFRAEGQLALFD